MFTGFCYKITVALAPSTGNPQCGLGRVLQPRHCQRGDRGETRAAEPGPVGAAASEEPRVVVVRAGGV